MKKIMLLLMAILIISSLSGCVDTKKSYAGKNAIAENKSLENTTLGSGSSSISDVLNISTASKNFSGNKSGWCVPGSKLPVELQSGEKTYTVVGITTYQGHEVCQADMISGNSTSTKYFSEDGKFQSMASSATGSGSVSVEASTHVNSTE